MNSLIKSWEKNPNQRQKILGAMITVVLWFFLWYSPWQQEGHIFTWINLGVGLILFIIPGASLYGILVNRSNITLNHITFGFVFSHLLVALLGTWARIVQQSFMAVKILFVLIGLIFLVQFLLLMFRQGVKLEIQQIQSKQILPILMLLLVAAMASQVVIHRVIADDDLTYLAYLTNWQTSTQLNFQDIFFGETGIVHPRYWIMSAPFAQALLADVAKIPGILLLGGYYEPFLVMLAVASWYKLTRSLSLSPHAASAASILQLVFLLFLSDYLHPGASFFTQLSTDKATAAFIMVPVFFQSLFQYLKKPLKNNWIISFLTGLSLTFIHPVVLAYSVFIGGVLILINWKNLSIQKTALAIVILVLITLPQASLRFVDTSSQVEIPYTSEDILSARVENMVTIWRDTQFYGFNSKILDMNLPFTESAPTLLTRGWLLFPLFAFVFSLKRVGKKADAQFLFATFLLGFLVWLPFTGWLIGYFLSAWMLERALWLFPFGLSFVYSGLIVREHIKKPYFSPTQLLSTITVIAIALFALYMHENNLPNIEKFTAKVQRYEGLATAGQKLDKRIPGDYAFVLGSKRLNDLVPGISSDAKIITFRISDKSSMAYFSDAEIEKRISDTEIIFSNSLSPTDKMALIKKYDISFLFLRSIDMKLFKDFVTNYPDRVEVFKAGGVILLQIKD